MEVNCGKQENNPILIKSSQPVCIGMPTHAGPGCVLGMSWKLWSDPGLLPSGRAYAKQNKVAPLSRAWRRTVGRISAGTAPKNNHLDQLCRQRDGEGRSGPGRGS